MKGPAGRLRLDVRRVWLCPVCQRTERSAGWSAEQPARTGKHGQADQFERQARHMQAPREPRQEHQVEPHHGANDAQKAMGIVTLALVSAGQLDRMVVPTWVILSCALAMGLGTAAGGWRIIRTLGMRIIKMEPVHGFAAETSAALILLGTAHFGMPVSTTHTITSSIMGVGAVRRLSAVRWGVSLRIVYAWIFTLPGAGLVAYGLNLALQTLR